MSNNIVFLSGWLEVERVDQVEVGKQLKPVVRAWVYTDDADSGGRQPLILEDKPAEVLLAWAKEHAHSRTLPQVVVQGKLWSKGPSTVVLVKFVRMFGMDPTDSARILEELQHLVATAQGTGPLRGGLLRLLGEHGYRTAGAEAD